MKSIALYWSYKPNGGVTLAPYGWIRMEVLSESPADALALCRPRKGEIVLNTVPLNEPKQKKAQS
jgi:hypothetical protein